MSTTTAYNELASLRDAILCGKINSHLGKRLSANYLPFVGRESRIAEFFSAIG